MSIFRLFVDKSNEVYLRKRKLNTYKKFKDADAVLHHYYPKILMSILKYLDTPKSLAVFLAIKYYSDISTDDLKKILQLSPRNYFTVHDYQLDAQAVAVLKKTEMFDLRYDTDDHLTYYLKSEALARAQREQVALNLFSFETRTLINDARGIVHSILGKATCELDETRFGPGATYALKGNNTHVIAKLEHVPECTPLAHNYVYRSMIHRPLHVKSYNSGDFDLPIKPLPIVPGDRLSLVKKDIFKPRVMCPQPTGNMLIQLDIAEKLEHRFYRYSGIKLSEQDSIHGQLMHDAWDLFGTIDLSDASDSISLAFLELVFPPDWYNLIRDVTTRQTYVDGKWYPNAKAFPQGCGLTFIVETILFYALSCASVRAQGCEHDYRKVVSVYGDDIIVPINSHNGVVKFLTDCGFAVNKSKSFGPLDTFKESCGVDTITGINVRPIYFKKYAANQEGFTLLANSILRVSEFINDERLFDTQLSAAVRIVAEMFAVAGFRTTFVPRQYSENEGIWSDTGWRTSFRKGRRYLLVNYEYRKRLQIKDRPWSTLAAVLLGNDSEGITVRNTRSHSRTRWTPLNRGSAPMIAV